LISSLTPTPSSQQKKGDQRLPHDSQTPLSESDLSSIGVLYYRIPEISGVDALAAERGYKNRDEITVSPEKMGDVYESKVKMFFDEHLHEDEEIRYVRDGRGYFDVRDKGDRWVRIALEKDDLIILPAGIYHRFTTDESNVGSISGGKGILNTDRECSTSTRCACSRRSPSGRP
jgi:1,2-dihydroxy-3-keto-5-methylthiopentene dioxygenase